MALSGISIVIPTKNGAPFVDSVLDSIFRQKIGTPFEVIIIDSGSKDKTLAIIKKYPINLIRIKAEEFNHGLTRNLGIEKSRCELVVLITQDALPADELWLERMVKNFDDEKVAGVYCRQIPRDNADVLTKRQLNNWLTAGKKRDVKFIENREEYSKLSPMEKYRFCNFDNVCSVIRKKVWRKIPFDEVDFAEDIAWAKKVLEAGYKVVYEPETAVIHSHNRSIAYEYQRTYLCHRRLYQVFKLQTVPGLKQALMFPLFNLINDTKYVLNREKRLIRLGKLLLKIPFLSFLSVFAQYKGAKDEKKGTPVKKRIPV